MLGHKNGVLIIGDVRDQGIKQLEDDTENDANQRNAASDISTL